MAKAKQRTRRCGTLITSGWNASPLLTRFGGHDRFAIDCTHLGGSSGSPVLLVDHTRPILNVGADGSRTFGGVHEYVRFLGVLTEGHVTGGRPIGVGGDATEPVPSGIGFVVRARALDQFIESVLRVGDEDVD